MASVSIEVVDLFQPPQGLAECERVIERGLKSFVEVGQALITIRDGRLYRNHYPTFEAYCEHRWGISRPRAYELVHAAEKVQALSAIADTPLPANEGQARELSGLEPEEAAAVMTEAAVSGKVTAASIREARERLEPSPEPESVAATGAHVGNNSGEVEWYTPRVYITAAAAVMGGIDLDPASSQAANEVVGARRFYSAADDGLGQPWAGRVWMNPPYRNDLMSAFCERLTAFYESGEVSQAVVLTNNATETRWYQHLAGAASAICLHSGRIRFWYPDRPSFTPLQGQTLLYLGPDVDRFAAEFCQFGVIVATTRQ